MTYLLSSGASLAEIEDFLDRQAIPEEDRAVLWLRAGRNAPISLHWSAVFGGYTRGRIGSLSHARISRPNGRRGWDRKPASVGQRLTGN